MSENIIEISSEETEDESNEYSAKSKLGAVHTLSSSDSYSDDEHKSPVNRSSAVSKKQYTIPKLSQYKEKKENQAVQPGPGQQTKRETEESRRSVKEETGRSRVKSKEKTGSRVS
uniref:Uncharacterized protein n=1 Tax=Cacopsylla melanoneura TaxID=428564 RepID=A0A8D8YZH8_9HEMI